MYIRMVAFIIACLMAITLQPAQPTHAAQRCFSETNQCIDGRIREFWEQNGGLAIFGFPIGPEEQAIVDGKTITVQRFERNRLELHPENARPYDVLLGRLGADRLAQQGRDWFTFAKNGDTGGCKVFAETGHSVCGAILNAWRKSGLKLDNRKAVSEAESLALFGLPLSDLQTETMADGKQYQVQWFERARFELHPENSAPYDVLLGLLANEVGGAPAAALAPAQTVIDPLYVTQSIGPMTRYDPYKENSWEMRLQSFKFETTSREDYHTPKNGYTFLIVNMEVKNLGPDESSIADYNFNVLDANGRLIEYEYMGRIRSCNLDTTLMPGGFTSGCMAFEVPNTGRLEVVYAPFKYSQFVPGRYLKWVVRP
ncbi:MAG: DUF4352 domain-containing protein [Chloroflexaceae bacterium]|nr:DUF4352 domain-containing protein [Chloroflexaceae bacterium]